jgi:hypothetical protein
MTIFFLSGVVTDIANSIGVTWEGGAGLLSGFRKLSHEERYNRYLEDIIWDCVVSLKNFVVEKVSCRKRILMKTYSTETVNSERDNDSIFVNDRSVYESNNNSSVVLYTPNDQDRDSDMNDDSNPNSNLNVTSNLPLRSNIDFGNSGYNNNNP